MHSIEGEGWGGETRKRDRDLLASKHCPFATAPADVHKLTWALAKLSAPAEAKSEHIPQESGWTREGWTSNGSLRTERKWGTTLGKADTGGTAEKQESQGLGPGRVRGIQNWGDWGTSFTKIIITDIILTTGPICVLRNRPQEEMRVCVGSWGLGLDESKKGC